MKQKYSHLFVFNLKNMYLYGNVVFFLNFEFVGRNEQTLTFEDLKKKSKVFHYDIENCTFDRFNVKFIIFNCKGQNLLFKCLHKK